MVRHGLVLIQMPPQILRISKVRGRELRAIHLLRTLQLFSETEVAIKLHLVKLNEFRAALPMLCGRNVILDLSLDASTFRLENALLRQKMNRDFDFARVKISRAAEAGRGDGGGGGAGGGAKQRPRVTEQLYVMLAAMTGNYADGRAWNAFAFSHPIVCICHDNQR